MQIFVTGGAGFIGSNFIHHTLALHRNITVVNYDKLTYAGNLENVAGLANHPNYRFIRGDICDGVRVLEAMRGCDVVVHFAAESHVDRSIYEPGRVIDTNITGTFILLKVARELQVKRFIHVSTDEVYGDLPAGVRSSEEFPLAPSSPYAASKAAADMLVRSFVRTYGFPALITRASNNYGPYQFPEKFLPLIISNALADKPLPVYGDGRQQRDWLHVEDHCRGILAVIERGRVGEIYNLGGGSVEMNISMVRRVLRLLGKSEDLISYVTDRPGHDRRYALDCTKAQEELGWTPTIGLEDGLQSTVTWYERNSAWLERVREGEYREYYERYYVRRDATIKGLAAATLR